MMISKRCFRTVAAVALLVVLPGVAVEALSSRHGDLTNPDQQVSAELLLPLFAGNRGPLTFHWPKSSYCCLLLPQKSTAHNSISFSHLSEYPTHRGAPPRRFVRSFVRDCVYGKSPFLASVRWTGGLTFLNAILALFIPLSFQSTTGATTRGRSTTTRPTHRDGAV